MGEFLGNRPDSSTLMKFKAEKEKCRMGKIVEAVANGAEVRLLNCDLSPDEQETVILCEAKSYEITVDSSIKSDICRGIDNGYKILSVSFYKNRGVGLRGGKVTNFRNMGDVAAVRFETDRGKLTLRKE